MDLVLVREAFAADVVDLFGYQACDADDDKGRDAGGVGSSRWGWCGGIGCGPVVDADASSFHVFLTDDFVGVYLSVSSVPP